MACITWGLTDDMAYQVAALRLIEKLQLVGTGANKAIAWVGEGKDPSQFGDSKKVGNDPKDAVDRQGSGSEKGSTDGKPAKVLWDPKVPDCGLAAKVPDFVRSTTRDRDSSSILSDSYACSYAYSSS